MESCKGLARENRSYEVFHDDFYQDITKGGHLIRGLTCTVWLTNDLIDGGQPRAKNSF